MEEVVYLPVIADSTADVPQLNNIKKEFPISDANSHELTGRNFQLKIEEDIKSEAISEASLHAIVDFIASDPNVNQIKKEVSYFDPDVDGNQDGARVQLLGYQIKSEAPDMKFGISSGDEVIYIKLEPFVSDELHITDETDQSPTDDNTTCNYGYVPKDKLQQHMGTNTGEVPYMKTHTEEKPFTCGVCDYNCAYKNNLQRHMNTHTGEKLFKCGVCSYSCATKCRLQVHMNTHTGKKPFKCNACDYRSVQKRHLQQHMKTHTGEKPFKCNVCDYRTRQKGNLQKHMKTHTREKPFKCNACDYRSVHKSHLQKHMSTHTGEKPFKCNVCDYRTVRTCNLRKHMKTHTGEKPFKCGVCGYSSAYKDHLPRHMNTHTGRKRFQCNSCNYKCTDNRYLQRHIKQNHI